MDHFTTTIFGKTIVLRDLVEDDIEAIVSYWHDGDPAFLHSLGADPAKLVSRETTRERLLSSLDPIGLPAKAYFVLSSGRDLLAYTNLNFRSASEAFAHFHVLHTGFRIKAVMYVLFPEVVRTFFSRFPLERIEMQTRHDNRNIDRLLRRFGLTPRQEFLDTPDGFGRAGNFNIYELKRSRHGNPLRSR